MIVAQLNMLALISRSLPASNGFIWHFYPKPRARILMSISTSSFPNPEALSIAPTP